MPFPQIHFFGHKYLEKLEQVNEELLVERNNFFNAKVSHIKLKANMKH